MFHISSAYQLVLKAGLAAGCALVFSVWAAPVQASGPQCAPRQIAANIKAAVLALKATEYCRDENLPYTIEEVTARIESLRCGPQSSAILDDLIDNYEREYKTIMTTDVRMVVCQQALSISLQ